MHKKGWKDSIIMKERKEALMKMGLLHTILTFTLQE
ncbi:hypothetical protein SEEA0292_07508 [Salmonella enterica subsp. enterica serovar Agona str. 0292]|nr:hypothetical protein SEEA0322_21387 [Salmonella enterica subsp. enterica serovar Agona str. 0322]ESC23932.1 hypothetical protein SEEA0292_07508 [Salmonella enterica subsp. enterica serovar Agona str. 0292]ESC40339.1 hypothetical protein SEEACDC3_10479 [Salmonella enterica subsp. enterica serovar Agona str. SA-3]ESO47672.1 hypothetical protein SEEA8691_00774 [Salmonella enterica subsp. enterica serovar Agona str. 392869-1]